MFRTVGLIGKHGDERTADTMARLAAVLRDLGAEILVDADSADFVASSNLPTVGRDELGRRSDLVIVIAGDGTFLGTARALVEHDVPLLGINLGRLGFLADISPDEMRERLGAIFAGRFTEELRFLLRARLIRDGVELRAMDALNDVVVHKWNIARLIAFDIWIDGRLVNRQRADGLIVATPTGSTAYALSGGGPIVDPSIDAVIMVPICPHTLSSRPLVVPADSRLELRLAGDEPTQAQLTCDGQTVLELAAGDRVVISKKREKLRLIHPADYDYYDTLRAKLHWAREL